MRGALAGVAGTAAMDALWYYRYRRGGGQSGFVDWETSAGLQGWADAPALARFGRLVIERTLHRDLPARQARVTNNVVHWSTGAGWGTVLGTVQGVLGPPTARYGLVLGAAVWLQSYAVLAPAKLYRPIWDYDAKTLGKDLSAHLLYGLTTAVALRLSNRWSGRRHD
ncbi:hypothetical protein M1247_17740 [Mycobacterium sp. 21AC1]|uniref:hypothetical protein n=1 Tax=[Mycobacterium] appelbergii TaxID=2939269 RepID=UPI002938E994|nr:hypothetical protein [Mycobacterium sp. 21AC1]MDV3126768.1 hypothetical protein [Mycobacterium sp. 21AC1]